MATDTSSPQAQCWVGWSYFTWGCDAHWLLEEPSLHQASLPFWLLQALSNWLTLGFARSSARLAASPWLHWITWNGSLRNSRLKGSQHFWSFLSPSQHSSASCHGRLCSLFVKSPFLPCYTVLNFTCMCPSTQAKHMTALNWGFLISPLFLNHKGQGNFTFLSSQVPNSSS